MAAAYRRTQDALELPCVKAALSRVESTVLQASEGLFEASSGGGILLMGDRVAHPVSQVNRSFSLTTTVDFLACLPEAVAGFILFLRVRLEAVAVPRASLESLSARLSERQTPDSPDSHSLFEGGAVTAVLRPSSTVMHARPSYTIVLLRVRSVAHAVTEDRPGQRGESVVRAG